MLPFMALSENLAACRSRLVSDVELFDQEVNVFSMQLRLIYVPGPITTVLKDILRVRKAALSSAWKHLSVFYQRTGSTAQS